MKKLELFSCIAVEVMTPFGVVEVSFTVVDVLGGDNYALIAQHRIVVCEMHEDGSVSMSSPTDLMDEMIITSTNYQTEFTK